jgi:hypothetical protein
MWWHPHRERESDSQLLSLPKIGTGRDEMPNGSDFYANVPVFREFSRLADPDLYRPLPDDWLIGMADVVNSTQAVQDGRYKVVNTAGAAVIAAVMNACRQRAFPFVFGGDGASFAVAPEGRENARAALAATAAWAREDLGLALRVALIPVSSVRARGFDVRVARFAPSRNVSYAMFSGGGIAWASEAMKAGEYAVEPGPAGTKPDLTGLSCRWEEVPSLNGTILSLVLVQANKNDEGFRDLVTEILRTIEDSPGVTRPLRQGPELRWPSKGLDIEARAQGRGWSGLLGQEITLFLRMSASYVVFRFGLRVGRFDPGQYRRQIVENSDFRKYDDGLRMTLDCTPDFADKLECRLAEAERAGIARFGLYRQKAALLTCITPSVYEADHVHFLDGAAGGYALASLRLKEHAGERDGIVSASGGEVRKVESPATSARRTG